jgi:hypothetical protein
MDYETLINDPIAYTRETFFGHWVRWLIFILLSLPFALVRFLIDPARIITGKTIRWELIPWGALAVLFVVGVLASFFISGYVVRIYRGMKPAPDFTGWASLFADGIRLDIVVLVWFLPALIMMLLLALVALGGFIWPGIYAHLGSNIAVLLLVILLLFVASLALLIIGGFYSTMGAIRFARKGSMVEGWRFSILSAIIRRIGWWNYFIALLLLMFIAVFFNIAVSLPAIVPYIGWIVPVCLSPLLTVFSARYMMLIYEAGEGSPAPAPVP